MKNKEEILKEFWSKVIEVSPNDINSDSIKVVGDDDVKWLIAQTREETIREVEERLPKAQKINKKDWLGLNYTLGDVKYREHQYRLLVLDILNKLKK